MCIMVSFCELTSRVHKLNLSSIHLLFWTNSRIRTAKKPPLLRIFHPLSVSKKTQPYQKNGCLSDWLSNRLRAIYLNLWLKLRVSKGSEHSNEKCVETCECFAKLFTKKATSTTWLRIGKLYSHETDMKWDFKKRTLWNSC